TQAERRFCLKHTHAHTHTHTHTFTHTHTHTQTVFTNAFPLRFSCSLSQSLTLLLLLCVCLVVGTTLQCRSVLEQDTEPLIAPHVQCAISVNVKYIVSRTYV